MYCIVRKTVQIFVFIYIRKQLSTNKQECIESKVQWTWDSWTYILTYSLILMLEMVRKQIVEVDWWKRFSEDVS
jgi:hypothetical protein